VYTFYFTAPDPPSGDRLRRGTFEVASGQILPATAHDKIRAGQGYNTFSYTILLLLVERENESFFNSLKHLLYSTTLLFMWFKYFVSFTALKRKGLHYVVKYLRGLRQHGRRKRGKRMRKWTMDIHILRLFTWFNLAINFTIDIEGASQVIS
jgi:hypothetical protein